MILYQTSQSVARDFSRRRVDRLHRHSPEVGKRVMRRSDADNTFDKHYTSGMIYTLSWPTINELSGRPVGRVALTDYDRMPPDIDGEGSPFDLARKRTTTFGSFAMTFVESSPGYSVTAPNWMPQSKHDAPPAPGILSLYNRGDRRRWYWPCPHCGEYYEPSFGLLKWPDSKDIMECAEGAQMMCPHCGTLTAPSHKYDLNLQGKWLAEGQTILPGGKIQGTPIRSDIASFWLKGPAASFASWQTLVSNYLKAEEEFSRTGSQDALRSTVNTDQGEPYFERGMGSSRAPEDLKARAEDIGDDPMVPADVRFLLATIDVQANRWEVQVHGVVPPPGEGGQPDVMVIDRFPIIKSKRVDDDGEHYWVKPGTYIEDWDLITEQVLQRTYPLADGSGRRMMIKLTGCDSGGKKGVTSAAYAYWRNLRKEGLGARFLLVKGSGEPSAPRIQLIYPDSGNSRKGKRELAKGEIPVLMIQTDKVKDQLDNMLDRITPGGMIRFSDVLDDNFYTELTVEQKDMKGKWVNPRKYRNESWDLMVYVLALMSHLRVEYLDWDNPPGWAADWDKNDMIVGEQEENRFETKKKEEYKDLKSLAELLG
jgi:phage terminase large subunit GpA-like protein